MTQSFFQIPKISFNGQITVPVEMRRFPRLKTGDKDQIYLWKAFLIFFEKFHLCGWMLQSIQPIHTFAKFVLTHSCVC